MIQFVYQKNHFAFKIFAPDNDYYGQSPLAAAMRSNDTHNKVTEFQNSSDNAARPSDVWLFSTQTRLI